ncbi:hypothetical protein Tco_1510452 [Tanacetum coccineum]
MLIQHQSEVGEADEDVLKDRGNILERAATTASSLEAKQVSGNIIKTRSKATLNEPNPQGTSSGSGPKCQDTMGDTIAQTRVLDQENTKTAQAQEITSSKLRVKKLEKKGGSRTHKLKRLYKGRIADIDADAGINLVSTHFDADTDMFGVHDLVSDEVVVKIKVASKDVNLSIDEVTLSQALAALKSAKPKADKVMLQEPEQGTITTITAATTVSAASTRPKAKGLVIHKQEQVPTPTVSSQQPSQLNVQDKGKDKMVEPKKPVKKKELIRLDEEIASKLQAEFDEEVRLTREKAEKEEEANIVSWDNVQAMIDAVLGINLHKS